MKLISLACSLTAIYVYVHMYILCIRMQLDGAQQLLLQVWYIDFQMR